MRKLITNLLYLLIFTLPLTFTTINYELFEFPKFILLISFTLILTLATIIDFYTTKTRWKQLFITSKLTNSINIGIILIFVTQSLATIFSTNPHTSIFGYYSRFHQGLITTACYSLIYFITSYYLDNKSTQKIIKISISSAILISLYAILQRFGIDKNLWVQDVVNRPFSTLGQPNWLASYLLSNIFLSFYLHSNTQQKKSSPIIQYLVFSILFSALILTRSRSGLLAFILSYITYWTLTFHKKHTIHYSLFTILILLIIGTPYTPNLKQLTHRLTKQASTTSTTTQPTTGTQLASGGTESGDIRKIVWTGAIDLIKRRPFLGTGPETFAYSYYWVRPTSHNLTSEWDFLYNKAHNEYLNIASTTGLIGLLAYLYWHYAIFKTTITPIKKTKKANRTKELQLQRYQPALLAILISFTITNFFGFSVIPVYLLMVITSALPHTLSTPSNTPDTSFTTTNYLTLLLTSITALLIFPIRLFFADLHFIKGKNLFSLQKLEPAKLELQQAIQLNPNEPLYHSYLAETYAQFNSDYYLQPALQEIEFTRTHNPWHLNYYKSRTKALVTLAKLHPEYLTQAKNELEKARQLAPTDPKLAYNLGLVYSRLGKDSLATQQMQQAIQLKPDYYQPYYALSLLYRNANNQPALQQLSQQAKKYFNPLPDALKSNQN